MSRLRNAVVPLALIAAVTFVFVWRDLYEAAWSPRQIVLITLDGVRADRLGAYGYTAHPTSPNIDALAEQAVLFEQAFAAAPDAVAALAALHTGRVPAAAAAGGDGADAPAGLTLAESFHNRGIATAAFELPRPSLPRGAGLERGFTAPDAPPADATPAAWLQARARDPFFLWVHIAAGAPAGDAADAAGWSAEERAVQRSDALVGDLLRQLAALQMDKQLMVVLTAIPGEAAARGADADALRVPLLFATPVFAPAHVGTRVAAIDVFATIAALSGLPIPPDLPGKSLVPLLRGLAADRG